MAQHTLSTEAAKRIAAATLAVEQQGIGRPRPGAKQPVRIARTFIRGTLTDTVSPGGSVSMTVYNGASAASPSETITVYLESSATILATGTFVHALLEISSGRYYITSRFPC